MSGLPTVTKQIELLLQTQPDLRNDDIALMFTLWDKYYGVREPYYQRHWKICPHEEKVCRIRRLFNAKGMYLPTDDEVRKARCRQETAWRGHINKTNKELSNGDNGDNK